MLLQSDPVFRRSFWAIFAARLCRARAGTAVPRPDGERHAHRGVPMRRGPVAGLERPHTHTHTHTHHVDETCTHRLPENDSYVVAVLVGTAAATMCVMMVVVVPRCATLMLPNHMRNGHQGAPDSAIQTMRRSHLRLFDVQTNVQAPSGAM